MKSAKPIRLIEDWFLLFIKEWLVHNLFSKDSALKFVKSKGYEDEIKLKFKQPGIQVPLIILELGDVHMI